MALFYAAIGSCTPIYTPPPTLPSSIKQISAPVEAQKWLETVLTYEHDPVLYGEADFWAPCALTYQRKKGDCEDYAICAAAILREDVEGGFIITVENTKDKKGHAVFAYRLGGKWGMVSNNKEEFRKPEYPSLYEVVLSSFAGKYTEYRIYDYNGVDLINGNEDLEPSLKQIGHYQLPQK